jgi:hypothetical protein
MVNSTNLMKMDEFAGTNGTFTAHVPPFTDNDFRKTGKLVNFGHDHISID